jgi:hypothetical protein
MVVLRAVRADAQEGQLWVNTQNVGSWPLTVENSSCQHEPGNKDSDEQEL